MFCRGSILNIIIIIIWIKRRSYRRQESAAAAAVTSLDGKAWEDSAGAKASGCKSSGHEHCRLVFGWMYKMNFISFFSSLFFMREALFSVGA
jgi:hypothetical protein